MNEENWLSIKLRGLGIQLATVIVDTVFLSFWVVAQFLVDHLVKNLNLSGSVDYMVLLAFQIIFALSTLAPVIINIYQDISIMVIRARRQVRRERKIDEIEGEKDE